MPGGLAENEVGKRGRIRMAEENKVVFKCQKCGKPFIAKQGSRRKLCDDCLVERVIHKREKGNK